MVYLVVLAGVKSVNVDLSNQVVQVLGSLPVKTMADALEQTGRKARLIGQGNPNGWLIILLFAICYLLAKR